MKILLSTVSEPLIRDVVLGGVPQSVLTMIKYFPVDYEIILITKREDDLEYLKSLRQNITFIKTDMFRTHDGTLDIKARKRNYSISVSAFSQAQQNLNPDFSIFNHINSATYSRLSNLAEDHFSTHKTFMITHLAPSKSFMGERMAQLFRLLVAKGMIPLYNSKVTFNKIKQWEIEGTKEYIFSSKTQTVPNRPKEQVLTKLTVCPLIVQDKIEVLPPVNKAVHIGRCDPDRTITKTISAMNLLDVDSVIYTTYTDDTTGKIQPFINKTRENHTVKIRYPYKDMLEEIRDAKVFISSFEDETFGLAFAEAAVRGIPCIHITSKESAPLEHIPSCIVISSHKDIRTAYNKAIKLDRNSIANYAQKQYSLETYQKQWETIFNEYRNR